MLAHQPGQLGQTRHYIIQSLPSRVRALTEYAFRATSTRDHTPMDGALTADSVEHAVQILADRGLLAFEVSAKNVASDLPGTPTRAQTGRVKPDDAALALLQIATLCEAGVSLDESFANAAQASAGSPLGQALAQVHQQLRQGSQLSQSLHDSALRLRPDVIQLIAAGEASGKISSALRAAHAQLERDLAFRKEIVAGLTYPAVLMGSGVISISVMFIFVIPKFASVLDNPKADIPALAQWILKTGLWVGTHTPLVFGSLVAVIGAAIALASHQRVQQKAWDFMAKVWPFAGWIHHVEVASWASTLSLMLRNSVPLLTAIDMAAGSFRSSSRRQRNLMVLQDIRSGVDIATSLRRHSDLDPMSLSLVAVGERSGALPQTVHTLYELHFDRSKRKSAQIIKLAEPVAILLIALVLGAIMMSIMLAVTSMSTSI